MPNHVYCHILPSTDAGVQLLKEMVKGERGLAGYLIPMPKELRDTTSPSRIVTQEEYDKHQESKATDHWSRYLTQEMSDDLKDKYQFGQYFITELNGDVMTTIWMEIHTDLQLLGVHYVMT